METQAYFTNIRSHITKELNNANASISGKVPLE